MRTLNRRSLLKTAGVAGVAGAATALPFGARWIGGSKDVIAIHAVTGVPAAPLPAYASYVLEGHIDPAKKTGSLTRTVFAGAPAALSDVALPGLTRTMRVVDVREDPTAVYVKAVVADRSQLRAGESDKLDLEIDRASGTVRVLSGASAIKLALTR